MKSNFAMFHYHEIIKNEELSAPRLSAISAGNPVINQDSQTFLKIHYLSAFNFTCVSATSTPFTRSDIRWIPM